MEKEERPLGGGEGLGEKARADAPPRSLIREYAESGAVVIVMAFFFMTFVAQAAEVPSASMENTIYVGDRFLINKFVFAPGPPSPLLPQREIRRGDIVVFKYPAKASTDKEVVQYKTLFIKRVIGLPGETVEVRGANVYIDGKVLPEYRVETRDPNLGNDRAELKDLVHPKDSSGGPYAVFYTPRTLSRGGAGDSAPAEFRYAVSRPFRVPEGEYFVMGDNRDNSQDSRVWGTVPRDLVIGRAMFVIWSFDGHAPRSDAPFPFNFVSDFVNNTRWNRLGTMLR